jgi:D-alanine-D-alanine ligase
MSVPARLVIILHGAVAEGAPPDEQDVLDEVHVVAEALERLGYAVEPLTLTLDLEAARRRLTQCRPLVVFNLVESIAGSGRLIHLAPALLEELGLPYTGTPLVGMFLSSNKLLTKQLLVASGLSTPPWWMPDGTARSPACPGPWVVKSVWEHASIGIEDDSLVGDAGVLVGLITKKRRCYGGEWYAETYIDGREFNLALIAGPHGFEVLPPAEIHFESFPSNKPKIVGYAAKWDENSVEYQHTQRSFTFVEVDLRLLDRLKELALRCASFLQVQGYARVDFRVDAAAIPWILEVNANPCLSPDAGFVAATQQARLDFDEVIARILEAAFCTARASTNIK